jgi:aminodeoxyfutalosine synthase
VNGYKILLRKFIFKIILKDYIKSKITSGEQLTLDDGVCLFREFDLHELGIIADTTRRKLHGNNVYYVVNAHINPTNICKIKCPLCAFAANENDSRGYIIEIDEILRRVQTAANNNITQIHIVSSIHPSRPFDWYCDIISSIHSAFPSINIKAYTAVEIAAFAESSGMSISEVLIELRKRGLSSLPGGGAEIFDENVRKIIAPNKISAKVWLNVHRIAHKLGIVTNASMLFGHIETYKQRVDHLIQIRNLQEESINADFGYFDCFVPLVYHSLNTELSKTTKIDPISPQEILRVVAVSRLILNNVSHIKSYWVTFGESLAQVALSYGADDFDGTVFEEKIHHDAGSNAPIGLTEQRIRDLIKGANRIPVKK